MTAEEKAERADGVRRLANRLGCPSPSYISDPFLSLALGYPSVNPIYLEKWLVRIHKYEPWEEKESIRECIERLYGKEWADLAGRLI